MQNPPLSTRMMELLEKAANAFTRNINPFDEEWVVLHDVTSEEREELFMLIGRVLEDYVYDRKTMEGGDDR